MATATIFEAKTNLSELVKKAQRGETVIITSGRSKTPVAKLCAVEPVKKVRLGLLADSRFVLPDSFFDPLPPDGTGLKSENSARYACLNLGAHFARKA